MLLTGSKAHCAGPLALQPRKIRPFSFGSRSATAYRVDHVAAPLRLLELQSEGGILHLLLQGLNRNWHLEQTHHEAPEPQPLLLATSRVWATSPSMKVFLDFEASSLADHSYPIEIAWVFQDGRSESHLIAPAPAWDDWDPRAEAIHGISRATLTAEGEPHDAVARRLVEALTGHDLFASAPSWDGKWLSALLRAGGFPRHLLRLRDTEEALRETATDTLRPTLPAARLDLAVHTIVARAGAAKPNRPAHRALADATEEYESWIRARQAARDLAATLG